MTVRKIASSQELAKPFLEALGVWKEGIIEATVNFKIDSPVTVELTMCTRVESDSSFRAKLDEVATIVKQYINIEGIDDEVILTKRQVRSIVDQINEELEPKE